MTVLKIDAGKNAIVLGDETECRSSSILLVNLLMTDLLEKMFAGQDRVAALVQLRSQGQALPCTIELIEEGSRAVIRFADPQRLAAPGQAAVFYLGKMVIGGAQVFSSTAD